MKTNKIDSRLVVTLEPNTSFCRFFNDGKIVTCSESQFIANWWDGDGDDDIPDGFIAFGMGDPEDEDIVFINRSKVLSVSIVDKEVCQG